MSTTADRRPATSTAADGGGPRHPRNPARRVRSGMLHAVSIAVGLTVVVPIVFGVLGGF
jgi:hypothetical protein